LARPQYNTHMKANDVIQWTGTLFVLSMYVVMNLFPHLTPWNLIFGLAGAIAYFTWTLRVKNYPQMLINVVAITLCVLGLFKHFG
jgi:hypothetical protein